MNMRAEVLATLQKMGPFRPCAFYEPGLDILVVQNRNCSTTEDVPVFSFTNHGLSFLEDNYRDHEVVGLVLFGARRFCERFPVMHGNKVLMKIFFRCLSDNFLKYKREIEEIGNAFLKEAELLTVDLR